MEHSLFRDGAVGVQHPKSVRDLDLKAGEKVGDLRRSRSHELGQVFVSGPLTGFYDRERLGDELLYVIESLHGLLALLVDLAVPALEFRIQLFGSRERLQRLDAALDERPPAPLSHPAGGHRVAGLEPQHDFPAHAAALDPLLLVGVGRSAPARHQ